VSLHAPRERHRGEPDRIRELQVWRLFSGALATFGDFHRVWRLSSCLATFGHPGDGQRRRPAAPPAARKSRQNRVRPRTRAREGWRGRGAPAHGADRGATLREWAAHHAPLPLPGWLPRGGGEWRPLPARGRRAARREDAAHSGCRDGKPAKDLAEFCGSCWAPGQFPDLLLDSTAPPPPSSSSPPTIILILDGASGWRRRSRCSG
jgi:hypothetical protein